MAYLNSRASSPKRNPEFSDLDGSLRVRWIAREMGITDDEALGAVMLHLAGIEPVAILSGLLARLEMGRGGE